MPNSKQRGRGHPPATFEFQHVDTIEDLSEQLVRFVARSLFLTVCPGSYGEEVRKFADTVGLPERTALNKLGVPPSRHPLDAEFLTLVDEYLRYRYQAETYLSVFAAEVERFSRPTTSHESVILDFTWFVPLTNQPAAVSKPAALVRSRAAVAWFDHVKRTGNLERVLKEDIEGEYPPVVGATYRQRLDYCIDDLLTVTSMPAGQGHLEAAALAGRFGKYTIERVKEHVEHSPAGWRTLRAATQALLFAKSERDDLGFQQDTYDAVFDLICTVHDMNYATVYRARSFLEEVAYSMPRPSERGYRREYDTRIIDLMIERAVAKDRPKDQDDETDLRHSTSGAPVRERQTAAGVALSRIRSWDAKYPTERLWDAEALIAEPLREAAQATGGGSYEAGLDYAASYVSHRIRGEGIDFYAPPSTSSTVGDRTAGERSAEDEPRAAKTRRNPHRRRPNDFWNERPEVAIVEKALNDSEVQEYLNEVDRSLRPATTHLIAASLLAVSGIHRRRLIEALVTAGLGATASRVFARMSSLMKPSQAGGGDTRFLVENSVFLLSLTGSPDALSPLVQFAFPYDRKSYGRAVRMTALMGIGDLAHHIRTQDPELDTVRDTVIDNILRHGLSISRLGSADEPFTLPELRAALHVLTMMRHHTEQVEEFLTAVRAGEGIVYFKSDGKRWSRGDEFDLRSRQLAEWCLTRMRRRTEAFASDDRGAIRPWLVSPIVNLDEAEH